MITGEGNRRRHVKVVHGIADKKRRQFTLLVASSTRSVTHDHVGSKKVGSSKKLGSGLAMTLEACTQPAVRLQFLPSLVCLDPVDTLRSKKRYD
jgi:hypothetical protein